MIYIFMLIQILSLFNDCGKLPFPNFLYFPFIACSLVTLLCDLQNFKPFAVSHRIKINHGSSLISISSVFVWGFIVVANLLIKIESLVIFAQQFVDWCYFLEHFQHFSRASFREVESIEQTFRTLLILLFILERKSELEGRIKQWQLCSQWFSFSLVNRHLEVLGSDFVHALAEVDISKVIVCVR